MARKLLRVSVAAITVATVLLTIGSGVALAQVVASATGSGQFHVSGDLRTFTFNANTDSSGARLGKPRVTTATRGLNGTAHSTV